MESHVSNIKYCPSKSALRVLIKGNILAKNETPQHMFERVVRTIFSVERAMGISVKQTEQAKKKFAKYMANKMFTPGTPTLTNAGRPGYERSALSSCAIIPANLNNKQQSERLIKSYYRQNMGSGFDLTPYENPIELLIWLNNMAIKETESGKYDRYIGNMANLHVAHPLIQQFIALKKDHQLSHFNCSVVVDNAFMEAAIHNTSYPLSDGTQINAKELLLSIASSAWKIGDPSIINLERMNKDNPIQALLPYISAPPCAEMGLSKGETCQFIYINIAKFCTSKGINYRLLNDVVQVVVRALDNAVEYGITRYPSQISTSVARLKRKIGIAVSGIADTCLYYGIPYASPKSLRLVRDIVSFINFSSKQASVVLAKERGSCEAMKDKKMNAYYHGYLKKRYNFSTHTVSRKDWEKLNEDICQTGLLRNLITTTQPPAARVSFLMDCSFGIEPFFGIPSDVADFSSSMVVFVKKYTRDFAEILRQASHDGTFQKTTLPRFAKRCLRTATEISPVDHIKMVAALVGTKGVIDETASKTVNLSKTATINDVVKIFVLAHQKGLKNISIYRDGSYEDQPYKMTNK